MIQNKPVQEQINIVEYQNWLTETDFFVESV